MCCMTTEPEDEQIWQLLQSLTRVMNNQEGIRWMQEWGVSEDPRLVSQLSIKMLARLLWTTFLTD